MKRKVIAEKLKKQTTLNSDLTKIASFGKIISDFDKKLLDALSSIDINELNELEQYTSPYNEEILIDFKKLVAELKCFISTSKADAEKLKEVLAKNTVVSQTMIEVKNSLQDEFAEIRRDINQPNLKQKIILPYHKKRIKISKKLRSLNYKKAQKKHNQNTLLKLLDNRNTLLLNELNIYNDEISKINSQQDELQIAIEFKGDKESFKSILIEHFKGSGISNNKYSQIASHYTDMASLFIDTMLYDGKELKTIITPNEFTKVEKFLQR